MCVRVYSIYIYCVCICVYVCMCVYVCVCVCVSVCLSVGGNGGKRRNAGTQPDSVSLVLPSVI
jgi:hypothetical protein